MRLIYVQGAPYCYQADGLRKLYLYLMGEQTLAITTSSSTLLYSFVLLL